MLWALSDESPYRRVVCPKGTQVGFTELGLIKIGHGCEAGQSALVIQMNEATAKKVVKTKFRPMLRTAKPLKGMFPGRSADTGLHFSSPQADVMFAGSNSPSNFASVTVPFVLGDEVDRWSDELLKEGDPVALLENRIAEYGFLGKMFLPSSPTIEEGPVWREWLRSDQRVFECPCPGCGHRQPWLWENMEWAGRGTPEHQPETVKLKCVACAKAFDERAWKAIWGQGVWRATNPAPLRKDTVGFHLSTLYARFGQRTWAQLVQAFETAVASSREAELRVFYNTILGLPWKVSEEALAADDLKARLEDGQPSGVCPEGALLLTAGVDYQGSWIEVWVWAWGRRMERWPVARIKILRLTGGTPESGGGKLRASADLARDLNELALERDWPHAKGGALRVEMAIHDAGDRPALVFDVLEHLSSAKNLASKGLAGWGERQPCRPPKIIDVRQDGKVVARGRRHIPIHTAYCKSEFYEDLRRGIDDADRERFVHLPDWLRDEDGALEGLVAEELRRSTRGKPVWHKIFARNEPLDCAILARIGHWQMKAHRWAEAEWARREAVVASEPRPPSEPNDEPQPRSGGGWINTGGKRWI